MPTAEWCAEAERDVSQFTGDSSIHRGTSHFHRRFRNDFWCQRGTGSLLLHLFARFVCQFWYTYYIILLIYIYTYTLVNLLWQRFLVRSMSTVATSWANFLEQDCKTPTATVSMDVSVNGDSVSRCTQVIPVGDGNTGDLCVVETVSGSHATFFWAPKHQKQSHYSHHKTRKKMQIMKPH
jgi:hypothetical protein